MEQLDLRRFEIYTAWNALNNLVAHGDHSELTTMDDAPVDWASFHDKIEFSSVQVVGHSFGGATIFHVLSTPPDEGFSPLPVSHTLFLDPWLLPFPKPGPKPINPDSVPKTLILHSEEFTLRKPGFLDLMLGVRESWSNSPAYTVGEGHSLRVIPLPLLTDIQSSH
jgi:platelet-activating factor acetylhydrolase